MQGQALTATDALDIPPLQSAAGLVKLPGSKSISNRVLLLAGLAEGQTQVEGLLAADDTRVMLDALMALGCEVRVSGSTATVRGLGGKPKVQEAKLFLGNAGTAMRPLTAALAVMSALHGGSFELSGVPRMHERPIGDLVDALRQLGCLIDDVGTPGYPPLRVHGLDQQATQPHLNLQQPIRVRGDVSSQFLTALLLAAPLAAAQQAVHFEVVGELISKPYIDITLKLLGRFGVAVQRDGWQRFTVPAGSRYQSPGSIAVEGDASGASYFIGLGAIAASGEPIRIEGLGAASIQGDIRFVEAAQAMGANVQLEPNAMTVRRGAWPLKAVTMDCNHIPDAAMTLAVMALYAHGTTRLNNVASWRVKETDRIAAMAAELRKVGAVVVEGQDFIEVTPPATLAAWRAPTHDTNGVVGSHTEGVAGSHTHGVASIHTYDDHRMAMSFSLAAFNPAGLVVRIEDPHCVAKTYPGYFDDFFRLVHANPSDVPVITVDGPTASGKGTVASRVADSLGYHHLDSGALYRATALSAVRQGIDLADATHVSTQLAALASTLPLTFEQGVPYLGGKDISADLRHEAVGAAASQISALPAVRQALHALQLSFRRAPGLVADGRDMGTVIFPDAGLKIFLTAGSEKRAERRHKQLISKGISANISTLRADLEARDARDKTRSTSPLMPAQDAKLLDNSSQTVDETVAAVLAYWTHQGHPRV